jgi:methionyl-tRNA synthetase
MNEQLGMNIGIFVLYVWSFIWKGIALWHAAKQNQRNWFIVILVLNTIGILEIVYLFRFAKKRTTVKELKKGFKDFFSTKDHVTK